VALAVALPFPFCALGGIDGGEGAAAEGDGGKESERTKERK